LGIPKSVDKSHPGRAVSRPEFIRVGFDPDFVGYSDGLELQQQIHREVVSGGRPDTVLLLEHESVYTAGKRTEAHELPADKNFVETNRGGKLTWHGPGQLVGYPIMQLPQPIDVVSYVRWLEQLLIDAIAQFGVLGVRNPGNTGVWVEVAGDGGGELQKIAAIGIRVSQKVTMHGFALNCSNSLEPYEHIIACGLPDVKAITLSQLAGEKISPVQVAAIIEQSMGEIPNVRAQARA
jgi:lipoyl(octanoyl) transferase